MIVGRNKEEVTFKDQIAWYMQHLQTRNRGRAKPATLALYQAFSNNHVLPMLGEIRIESFTNGPMKKFVQQLNDKKLSPKTVKEISSFVRSVIASAVDDEGNKLYPREWNHRFIDAVPVKDQRQPTITREALQLALKNKKIKVRDRVFVATLASTGLRLGEMLALKIGSDPADQESCWDVGAQMIRIRKSVWRGKLQAPKTYSAVRDIDISEPVNDMLKKFADGRKPGAFLFATKTGQPLSPKYIRTYILEPLQIPGAHSLRRLRVSYLREVGCNESILKAWLGHSAGSDVTNKYDKSADNIAARKTWAERCGTGLDLSDTTTKLTAPRNGKDPSAKIVVKRSLVRRKPVQSVPVVEAPTSPAYIASDEDLSSMFFEKPAPTPTQEELNAELAGLEELCAILEGVR
jgi:integrase